MADREDPAETDDAPAGTAESSTASGERPTADGPGPSPLAAEAVARVETAVPEGEQPAGRCDHCGRPFRSESALALHRGEVHGDLTDDEVAAYEAAIEAERDELFFYHIRVVVALGVLYALSVVAYMVVFGG